MEFLFIGIYLVVAILAIFLFKSPKTKGALGEWRVQRSLGKNIPNEKYIIHDLLVATGDKSYQIDHVVIKRTGIFVIETKNFSGLIFGQDRQREWTQTLAYGQEKNRFYNPIFQNKHHIHGLKEILGRSDGFISIVVFPKATLMTSFDSKVGSVADMQQWLIEDRPEVFSAHEIETIYERLMDHKKNPRLTNEQHLENIYKLQEKIENDICPRCGKKLQLRTGRYGAFYGCTGYPSCRFIKKIKAT